MIYQLDGKNVKNKPTGTFKKIVEIPGKLMNFITKDVGKKEAITTTFQLDDGKYHHFVVVKNYNKTEHYVDGVKILVT